MGIRRGKADTPPLLIFNGVGANLELVEPFSAALEGVETVVFDVPRVGGSPLPDLPYRFSTLARLADRLLTQPGYEGQVDELGVSWGGALASSLPTNIRKSSFYVIDDGHPFLVTRAREVAPVVREFLAEGAGGRGGCQEIALKAASWKREAR